MVDRELIARMDRPSVTLTGRFAVAVQYAADAHAEQARKGSTVPYIAHLLGVASLVLEAGGDEDQAIAGLLHDVVEDCGGLPRLAEVRDRFGSHVADIVAACSDSVDDDRKRSTDWVHRKQTYLTRLEFEEPDDALIVSVADKVHNARAIVTDLQTHGVAAMEKFHRPDLVLWYYDENLRIAESRAVPDALLLPLATAVAQLHDELRQFA